MIAPAIAQAATPHGLTTPLTAMSDAVTRAISPGSGMPRDSMPMIRPTTAYTAVGGMPSIQASMCKASTSVAGAGRARLPVEPRARPVICHPMAAVRPRPLRAA